MDLPLDFLDFFIEFFELALHCRVVLLEVLEIVGVLSLDVLEESEVFFLLRRLEVGLWLVLVLILVALVLVTLVVVALFLVTLVLGALFPLLA